MTTTSNVDKPLIDMNTDLSNKITSPSDAIGQTGAAPSPESRTEVLIKGGRGPGRRGGRGRGRSGATDTVAREETDSTVTSLRGGRGGRGGGGRGGRPMNEYSSVSQPLSGIIDSSSVQQEGKSGRGGGCPHKEGGPHWKDGELKLSGTGKPENRRGGHGKGHDSHSAEGSIANVALAEGTEAAE